MIRSVGLLLGAVAISLIVLYLSSGAPEAGPVKPPLDLPDGGLRFEAMQRTTVDLPGSEGQLRAYLSDITRGQVEMSLHHADGRMLAAPRSVRAGGAVDFSTGGQLYSVTLVEFDTKVIGSDKAVLHLAAGESESTRIERLLRAVAESGLVFVRNGSDHDATAAADHLRGKWESAGAITAVEFIEHVASRSSLTGRAYLIRLADGREVESGVWLRERLETN